MDICSVFGVFVVTLLIAAIAWFINSRDYWKRRNVPTESIKEFYRPKDKKHFAFVIEDIYRKSKAIGKSFAGIYNLFSPALVINDLDMLKTIYMTEFEAFPDRGLYSNPEKDPLSRNLLIIHGDLWKKMRNKLTPTFTSGKMKLMFPTVEAIGRRFMDVMHETVEQNNQIVEVRDLCARFTTDVIGSVAFGLDCNSLREPFTEFRVKGDKAFTTIHPLVENFASRFPKFFNMLGLRVFSDELIDFYSQIVRENVAYREKNNIKKNDFLGIMMELKNNSQSAGDFHMEMVDIIAQAFVFFIGGFETSSTTMTFALFELAYNPEIQEKARENVMEILEKNNGELTYESLHEMSYIKQVVQETLRKDPVVPLGKRVCRRKTVLESEKDSITIEPGIEVFIPVYSIHRDAVYYPQPEEFRPERFSPEEKDSRHPMAYLPFGAGPRSCIAERFGMMQSMMGIALLLKNFKFSVCKETPKTLEFDPYQFIVFTLKGGIHLKVERV